MSKDFSHTDKLEKFKKLLHEEEARLIAELQTVGRRNPENPDDWQGTPGDMAIDPADTDEQADRVEEFVERSAIEAELETQLHLVQKAKRKIEAGESGGQGERGAYGICEIGGEEIEEDRLEANPSAETCKKHLNG